MQIQPQHLNGRVLCLPVRYSLALEEELVLVLDKVEVYEMTSHPPRTRQLELVSNWFRFSIDIGLALAIGGQGGVSTISTQLWNTNRCRFSISHPRVWFQSCCIRYRLAIDIELALAIGGYDLLVGSNQCRFPLGGRFSYRIRQQMQIQHQPYTGMVLVMLQQIQISDGYRVSISHRRV